MRAIILAAGRGERLRPLTDHTPKPMLRIAGKPLIERHVERLVSAGIIDIVVNHAHLGEQIEAHLGDGHQWGARIVYSPEGATPLETAGGIVAALPLLGDAPFITVNADVWTDYPFQRLVTTAASEAHIVLVDNPDHNPRGDFVLTGESVRNEGERRLTFSGLSVFTPAFFAGLEFGVCSLTPLLKRAVSRGILTGSYYSGVWHDIGTPERLRALRLAHQ